MQLWIWPTVVICFFTASFSTAADSPDAVKPITNSIGIQLVRIEAGEFTMGAPETEEGYAEDEKQRRVKITKPFYIGKYETTVGQFRQFVSATQYKTTRERTGSPGFGYDITTKSMEELPKFNWKDPGFEQTDNHPVTNVGWDDAVEFCQWLSKKEAQKFRLPTEAEWEYTCRAGSTTRYWSGETEDDLKGVANISDASFLAKYEGATWSIEWSDTFPFTAPVGSFRANRFGLHDTHGNVWEWCSDWYSAEYYKRSPLVDPTGPETGERRILRGGAFTNRNKFVRSADRDSFRPKYRHNFTGFRVVREIN